MNALCDDGWPEVKANTQQINHNSRRRPHNVKACTLQATSTNTTLRIHAQTLCLIFFKNPKLHATHNVTYLATQALIHAVKRNPLNSTVRPRQNRALQPRAAVRAPPSHTRDPFPFIGSAVQAVRTQHGIFI